MTPTLSSPVLTLPSSCRLKARCDRWSPGLSRGRVGGRSGAVQRTPLRATGLAATDEHYRQVVLR